MNESEILDLIDTYEFKITQLKELIQKLKKEPKCFEEFVFQKYIEFSSLPKTAKFLKENGYRKPQGTLYITNDLSAIIQSKNQDVDYLLLNYAQSIFHKNSKAVSRAYG